MTTELPEVDFYILSGDSPMQLRQFCCRLAEKAWKLGNNIFVKVEDDNEARLLDDAMWTYTDISFLPHDTQDADNSKETPIIIGTLEPEGNIDLLINLCASLPEKTNYYKRIAELVNDEAVIKAEGRKRYAHYNQLGYPLQHHNLA